MAVLKIFDGSNFVDIANFDSVPKVAVTTDNTLARYDGTSGLLQASGATLSDGDDLSNVTIEGINVADDVVLKETFDANTVLAADSDNTPAALAVAEDTVVGRITGGNIDDIKGPSVAEVLFGDTFNTWVSNRWYNQSPGFDSTALGLSITLATDTVKYYPLFISHRVTFDNFGFHVAVLEAGKNARIAIYNAASNAPTAVVVESGNMSLAATGAVTIAVAETTLQAGQYFWGVNADSATAALRRIIVLDNPMIISLGSAAPGEAPGNSYTEASAFGAFPDPATPGSVATATNVPNLKLQVV